VICTELRLLSKELEDKGPILPTFYAQLLRAQIPKAQKTHGLTVFFVLMGSALIKAAHKMLMKLIQDSLKGNLIKPVIFHE